ncbi:MAG: sigma-70 family RNA polymerase sigma factor [Bacteroidales bacterium]|nr:sigma-70 family RNA polymerase sigma factor [Bacteroidales bacterium]
MGDSNFEKKFKKNLKILLHLCPIKKNSMPRINSLLDFRKIYDRYFNCLVIYSSGMGIPYQQAKDIVQECFIKLWENCSSVSNITSWLFTSVRNSSINWLKASKKSSGNVKLEEISHIHQHTAEDAIEYFHKVEEAYQKLQQLGGRCKDIFIMAYVDKMKIKEIAQELDLSENTVKTYLKRAKETLRLTIMIVALFLILHSCIN